MDRTRGPSNGSSIRSVERALDVLDFLRASETPQRLTEICSAAGLSAATAHRLLAVLAARDYVVQEPATRRYALGTTARRLGDLHFDTAAAVRRMRPELEKLSLRIGACVVVCAYEGPRVALLASFGGEPEAARMVVGLGRYMDAHATAAGKALLAHRPANELRELYRNLALRRHTEKTVTSLDLLLDQLERIHDQGYANVAGEFLPGLRALGIPLSQGDGGTQLALSLTYLRGARPCASDRRLAAEAIEVAHRLVH